MSNGQEGVDNDLSHLDPGLYYEITSDTMVTSANQESLITNEYEFFNNYNVFFQFIIKYSNNQFIIITLVSDSGSLVGLSNITMILNINGKRII